MEVFMIRKYDRVTNVPLDCVVTCKPAKTHHRSSLLAALAFGISVTLGPYAYAQGGVCYVELVCCGCDGTNCYIYDQCFSPTGCYQPTCVDGNCSNCGSCTWQCGSTIYQNVDCCSGSRPSANIRNAMRAVPVAFHSPGKGQSVSAKASVNLAIPSTFPLELVKVVGPSGQPIPHYEYVVRNIGVRPIVAMAIKWKVFVSGEGAPRATKTNIADSWMGGQTEWLTPSKNRSFVLSGIVTQDGKPVSRFEGVPVYVEFDDGTRLGADASSIFPELNRQRQALLNESRKALDIYSTSGKDA